MDRKHYEVATAHMHSEILEEQFGEDYFTEDQMTYLTTVQPNPTAFSEALDTLFEADVVEDNIEIKFVFPDYKNHGSCYTSNNVDGSFNHRLELATLTLGTCLHEVAHACCYDHNVYTDTETAESAHDARFDDMMKMIMNVIFTAKGIK